MNKAAELIQEAYERVQRAERLNLPSDVRYELERARVALGLALQSEDTPQPIPVKFIVPLHIRD